MKTLLKIIIISGSLLFYQWCSGQIFKNDDSKKVRYMRALSVACSAFDVTGLPSSPAYPALELRIGAGIVKPIGKYFDFKSGAYLGLKVKRQSYFFGPAKQYTTEPWVLPALDEAASSRNHFVLDIPFVLQFNPKKSRLGIRGGLITRFWAPNNDQVDILTARPEAGLSAGISHKLAKSITLGIDYYHGLTIMYSGNNSQYGELHVRNKLIQLTLEHAL